MARTFALGAKGRQFKSARSDLKKIFIVGIGLVLLIASYLYSSRSNKFFQYKLAGKTYKLLTAKNSAEWEKGLMFYRSKQDLGGADGMIFIFPTKDYHTFWNENTYLDLDLYWINDDKVIGKDYLPSILKTKDPYTINSPGVANKVIEIVR